MTLCSRGRSTRVSVFGAILVAALLMVLSCRRVSPERLCFAPWRPRFQVRSWAPVTQRSLELDGNRPFRQYFPGHIGMVGSARRDVSERSASRTIVGFSEHRIEPLGR